MIDYSKKPKNYKKFLKTPKSKKILKKLLKFQKKLIKKKRHFPPIVK